MPETPRCARSMRNDFVLAEHVVSVSISGYTKRVSGEKTYGRCDRLAGVDMK
jgi:hypothetical protein